MFPHADPWSWIQLQHNGKQVNTLFCDSQLTIVLIESTTLPTSPTQQNRADQKQRVSLLLFPYTNRYDLSN